jgi:hypothetical protein
LAAAAQVVLAELLVLHQTVAALGVQVLLHLDGL